MKKNPNNMNERTKLYNHTNNYSHNRSTSATFYAYKQNKLLLKIKLIYYLDLKFTRF